MPPIRPKNIIYSGPNDFASSNPNAFNAKQLASIYGYPPVDLSIKNVVGVLSFGGGLYGVPPNQSTPYVIPPYTSASTCDVQKTMNYLGYSAAQMPRIIFYPCNGAVNYIYDNDTIENTLDITAISGVCPNPNLTIILFVFPFGYIHSMSVCISTILQGINININGMMVNYVPTIISISWQGGVEQYVSESELTDLNTVLKLSTQFGINVCTSAGDYGSTNEAYNNSASLPDALYPTCCPYLTSVGGTTLKCPSKTVYDSSTNEVVWNWGNPSGPTAATGGGISKFYAKPDYQQNIPNITSNKRNYPDIALVADPNTSMILYFNGQLFVYGGTSLCAPLFAGFLAIINPNRFVNPLMYAASSAANFHDITIGNNNNSGVPKSYNALVGYDCCTGLGTIKGDSLRYVLAPTLPPSLVAAQSITLRKTKITLNLKINKKFRLRYTILPTNTTNKNVAWFSRNPGIATVSATGMVTGIRGGTAIIYALTQDGSNISTSASILVLTVI